ncbi:hypothetical protein X777_05970, partial [Ooceraea biroi]
AASSWLVTSPCAPNEKPSRRTLSTPSTPLPSHPTRPRASPSSRLTRTLTADGRS